MNIKSVLWRNELKSIGISVLVLGIGFAAMWAVKTVVAVDKDAVYVSVLLVPALVYMIVAGKLKEFKAPGGLEATFAEAASESVSAASEKVEPSVSEMQTVRKESARILQRKQRELNESKPIIMTMVIGKKKYELRATLSYIEMLSHFRNFKFVVFLDKTNHFVAYMPSWAIKGLLSKDELGSEFINVINAGREQDLFSYPGVVKNTISTQSTNVVALQEMTSQNLEALVVIDESRNLKGVVEREQILSKLMLALTK